MMSKKCAFKSVNSFSLTKSTTEFECELRNCDEANLKTMSLNIAQQFMKEIVKIYFGLLKIQVKFLIN